MSARGCWTCSLTLAAMSSTPPTSTPTGPRKPSSANCSMGAAKHVRRELEAAGFAYADGTGAIHVDLPGLLLHIEPERPTARGGIPRPAGMGAVGVRVVQCLLGDPTRKWSVADLARQAACAAGEAHRIIVRLEGEGFLEASGRGKALRRHVENPGALLDWLATVPSARRVRERLD